ncbi:hypothetical protein [Rhizobium sp. 007]|uniref:hypothetical protein n=1 Tax=Rhizobium sp. 007 TaxID=2785056 RepID=UPI001890A541|nr:hypothetical protein [Rhizobium sp. 007]QPB24549.1 hypothetical protein ISN39_33965 [Rhizobium sp. 007]
MASLEGLSWRFKDQAFKFEQPGRHPLKSPETTRFRAFRGTDITDLRLEINHFR